jgi:hypothetical protein
MATITKLAEKFLQSAAHVHRRPPIIDEIKHAKMQLHLQSQYPGREPVPDLPQSEISP